MRQRLCQIAITGMRRLARFEEGRQTMMRDRIGKLGGGVKTRRG